MAGCTGNISERTTSDADYDECERGNRFGKRFQEDENSLVVPFARSRWRVARMHDAAIGVLSVPRMNNLQRAAFRVEQDAQRIQIRRMLAGGRLTLLRMPMQTHDDLLQIDFGLGANAALQDSMTINSHGSSSFPVFTGPPYAAEVRS